MHVLFVPSWYPTTEAPLDGIYFAEQAQHLQEHGLRMGIVFPEQQSLRRLSWEAARRKQFQVEWTDDFGLPTLRRYSWNVLWRAPPGIRLRIRSAIRLARRYADRHGVPDLVHAHSAHWAGAAAARISDRFGVPYVLTEHFSGFRREAIFPWRWPLIEEAYRHASGLAAVSRVLKETIVDRGLADPDDVEIHPNPVRASLFTLPPEGRPTPPPFRLVTVARLDARKNVGGLLTAFARAFGSSEDATLAVVGDGPERRALAAQAERLGISNQTIFHGQQDREAVRDALWSAHAFVLSSRFETFGVALVEALATGLPVIATRCGGPEDILTEETGRLVPADNPDALATALRNMKERWSSYDAEAIRAHTLERYGPEPFVRRTRSFYRRARTATA